MPTFSNKEGFQNQLGTKLSFEGLASGEYQTIPVCIDAGSRDWGNPDGSNNLRPYLALGYDASVGKYRPYKSASQGAGTVVILAEEVRDIDAAASSSPGFVNSYAFIAGTFKKNVVIESDSAVTWSSVQRLIVRDNA